MNDLSESFEHLFHVTEVESVKFPPEYRETLMIDNVPVNFTIDTACPVSIVPESLYRSHFDHLPLQPAQLKLSSYSQHVVPVLGYLQVPVDYQGKSYSLPLYVTQGDDVALLGRQWLQNIRLNWQRVCAMKVPSMDELLKDYADVFSESPGTIKQFKAEIQCKEGSVPRFFKPRPVPYALRDKVAEQLHKLEKAGVLTKIDRSDWAAPIVVVPKQDKAIRICGDYKVTVNQVIEQEVYPLPTADDLFACLAGGQVFTKLDLSCAYQQLELTPESKKYLVINTHLGLYEYNRLSYGVSTAPNIFQRVMDQVLQGLPGVTCYLDDILIASDRASHVALVQKVLDRLRKFSIHVKRSKCAFMTTSVTYLGHQISAEGLRPTDDKVQAIQKLKAPTSVHELRVLLGIVNYYAKFVPNMSTLLAPWYKLLQKDCDFKWDEPCEKTLSNVKNILVSDRVLVHYDPRKPITLACDASPVGVGCVLSHVIDGEEYPIAYASRSLTTSERNYCQLEREGLAIIYGLTKFHKYIYGRAFTIITDNQPVARILGPKRGIPSLAAARLQRWALILMAHNYSLTCRSSQKHGNCDVLSRFPIEGPPIAAELRVNYFTKIDELPVTAKQIAEETRKNPLLAKAYDFTMSGWPAKCPDEALKPFFTRREELSAEQGCLVWGSRVVIPETFRARLLNELHEDHPGIVRMKSRARSYFWYPGIDSDIENLVSSCSACQSVQKDLPAAPLVPWTFPANVWQRVHIDFAEFNKQQYLVLVDAHSKWIDAIEMHKTTSSQTIKELKRYFAMFGLPEYLVSDNGPQFVSDEFENFLKTNGIKHLTSAPYHPATNGAAERTVQTVKLALKKFALSNSKGNLQGFLFAYRNTPHSTTGQTPAELFLRRAPRTKFTLLKPQLAPVVFEKQQAQKNCHDKHSRPVSDFSEGEVVRVKNLPHSFPRYVKGQVVEKLGSYHYRVKIGSRTRKVHVEHMRRTGELEVPSSDDNSVTEQLFDSPIVYHKTLSPCVLSPSNVPSTPVPTSSNAIPPDIELSPSRGSSTQSPRANPVVTNSSNNQSKTISENPTRKSTRIRSTRKRLIEEM